MRPLQTDDVYDELGIGRPSKPRVIKYFKVTNKEGETVFEDKAQKIPSLVQKHFGLTARWSKRGRWRGLRKEWI